MSRHEPEETAAARLPHNTYIETPEAGWFYAWCSNPSCFWSERRRNEADLDYPRQQHEQAGAPS